MRKWREQRRYLKYRWGGYQLHLLGGEHVTDVNLVGQEF